MPATTKGRANAERERDLSPKLNNESSPDPTQNYVKEIVDILSLQINKKNRIQQFFSQKQ